MNPCAFDVDDTAMAAIRSGLPFERVELAALNLGLEPLRRDVWALASVVEPPPARRRPWWVWVIGPAIVVGMVVGVIAWAVTRK